MLSSCPFCLNSHLTFYISTSFESTCDKLYIVTHVFIFDPPLYARMQLYLKHNASESSEYKNNTNSSHILKNQLIRVKVFFQTRNICWCIKPKGLGDVEQYLHEVVCLFGYDISFQLTGPFKTFSNKAGVYHFH